MRPSELPWKYINKKVVRIYFDHLEKKVCVGGGRCPFSGQRIIYVLMAKNKL